MKYTLLAAVVAGLTGGAAIAGSPEPYIEYEYTPPIEVEPASDWSGFYIGALGGIQNGDIIDTTPNPNIEYPFDSTNYGVFAGYNHQFNDFVGGVEIDAQMGSLESLTLPSGPNLDIDYLVDARARLGFAFDSVLLYGAGGFTTTKVSTGAVTATASGWNAGVGADIAVTDSVIIGGEYIYRDLSGEDNFANPLDVNSHGFQARVGFRF